eukprot:GFYU01013594.1.p1 GENE.GFYU01013594.1~~GFYU01013594.1.p1  ORF type:complete len:230 (+),score=30.44 GFYU01013594.1:27-716(+)
MTCKRVCNTHILTILPPLHVTPCRMSPLQGSVFSLTSHHPRSINALLWSGWRLPGLPAGVGDGAGAGVGGAGAGAGVGGDVVSGFGFGCAGATRRDDAGGSGGVTLTFASSGCTPCGGGGDAGETSSTTGGGDGGVGVVAVGAELCGVMEVDWASDSTACATGRCVTSRTINARTHSINVSHLRLANPARVFALLVSACVLVTKCDIGGDEAIVPSKSYTHTESDTMTL